MIFVFVCLFCYSVGELYVLRQCVLNDVSFGDACWMHTPFSTRRGVILQLSARVCLEAASDSGISDTSYPLDLSNATSYNAAARDSSTRPLRWFWWWLSHGGHQLRHTLPRTDASTIV